MVLSAMLSSYMFLKLAVRLLLVRAFDWLRTHCTRAKTFVLREVNKCAVLETILIETCFMIYSIKITVQ